MGTNLGQINRRTIFANTKINIGCNTLIIKGKKILLGKRKNCTGEGTWGLPGGHLEFGEDLIDAAIRELKEEIGIDAKKLKLVSVTEGTKEEDSHYIQINFLLEDYEGEIVLMEPDHCEQWKFFSLNNLPKIFFAHQNILEAYLTQKFYLK